MWIATSHKLRKYSPESEAFVASPTLPDSTRILSLQQFKNHLWVASIDGGLYQIGISNNAVIQYTADQSHQSSLLENHIRTIYISKRNHLWLANFSGGLSMLDLDQLNFDFETNVDSSISCARNSTITAIMVNQDKTIWLGTEYGLIKYDPRNSICHVIDSPNIETKFTVYSIQKDQNLLWLSSSKGLLKYDKNSSHITRVSPSDQFSTVFFSLKTADQKFILGTDAGLFDYSQENHTYKKYKSTNPDFQSRTFLKYSLSKNNDVLLPTSSGLLYLNHDNILEQYPDTLKTLKNKEITGNHINDLNELFISVKNEGLYYFDSNHALKKQYLDEEFFSSFIGKLQIQSSENSDVIWLGSKQGLIKINLHTQEKHVYSGTSQNNYLSLSRSSYTHENKLFFAGDNGYVSFKTKSINTQNRESPLHISQLSLANSMVYPNQKTTSGFVLSEPIEEIEKLIFSHRDNFIKLDFNNLDYYNHHAVKYAYKLEPGFSDWINLDHQENNLTFTHLETGNYELFLKTTNRDQVWSQNVKSIKIQVMPAPWFSWWAYLSYFLTFIFLVFLYVKQKTKNQLKTNKYLNDQVKKQTLRIENQKQELENLIERKDEIFSNVSHEFRTPITLIKGPISELTKQEKNKNKIKMLHMVERNSNRLLRLVNQMLKLSQTIEKNDQKKLPIQLAVSLELIAEPYLYQAQKNNILFSYDEFDDVIIHTTPDALELIIGNFLSNAFKYTQPNGKIHLGTQVIGNKIKIYVQDDGQGFDRKQKDLIFKRFGRLSHHHDTEGVGIGLAIVKETAALNHAEISVQSEPYKGSVFNIIFPISGLTASNEHEFITSEVTTDNKKPTLLIIEDNQDMRLHMHHILKHTFNCLLEPNGQAGIETAIKTVPDIIISDVMMPEMNGFHVCKILRKEIITSHIPLVLLTALNDKPSRIKGWQEGIDLYINKPFDAEELLFQLKNILRVRNILNKKNQSLIKNETYSDLQEIDKNFVIKLKNIIKDNYKDSSFGLAQMADLMIVSEKQLQRKTKGLLNLSPLLVLREYRFEQALISLRKGFQVAITSDQCGFSSVSHFSQLFKQQYGMSPKNYQQINKNPVKK